MENASKALIIAGAILLSIAIIGIGMYVFQMAQSSTEGVQLTTEQATAYNQKYLNHEGNNVRGSEVKLLCSDIRQHNLGATDDSLKIGVFNSAGEEEYAAGQTAGTTTGEINTVSNKIQSGKTYTVSFGYDPSSGYITAVYIVENTGN